MLTAKENLRETIKNGNPDRYVKRYEPFFILQMGDPAGTAFGTFTAENRFTLPFGPITFEMNPTDPGPMPLHGKGLTVIEDIENWQDAISIPDLSVIPEEAFGPWEGLAATCDRNQQFLTLATFPGLLDIVHMLMGMEEALMAVLTNPDEVKEIVNYYTDYLIEYETMLIKRFGVEAVHEHDDWGSKYSTLISPEAFRDIFLNPYRRLHAAYREVGIEIIIHHSDTYAATLVPEMIKMDVDIWQGAVTTNNIPALLDTYGSEITIMGGIDSDVVDTADTTPELIAQKVDEICVACGTRAFIPCTTMGGPDTIFPEVGALVDAEIDRMSEKLFR